MKHCKEALKVFRHVCIKRLMWKKKHEALEALKKSGMWGLFLKKTDQISPDLACEQSSATKANKLEMHDAKDDWKSCFNMRFAKKCACWLTWENNHKKRQSSLSTLHVAKGYSALCSTWKEAKHKEFFFKQWLVELCCDCQCVLIIGTFKVTHRSTMSCTQKKTKVEWFVVFKVLIFWIYGISSQQNCQWGKLQGRSSHVTSKMQNFLQTFDIDWCNWVALWECL